MRQGSKVKAMVYNDFFNEFLIIPGEQLTKANIDDEFKKDFKNWKQFLSAANKEKEWISQRITWFFTPQTILFATFSLINTKGVSARDILKTLNFALPIFGISSALLILVAIASAMRMHGIWHANLKKIVSRYDPNAENLSTEDQLLRFPYHNSFTFGRGPSWPAWLSRWAPALLILLFMAAWSVLFLCFNKIIPLYCSDSIFV